MADLIDGRARVIDDDEPSDTWMEPIPLAYRTRRANRALAIGVIFAIGWAILMAATGADDVFAYAISLAPLATGALIWWHRKTLTEERKFRMETTHFTHSQRVRMAGKWLAIGIVITLVVLVMQYQGNLMSFWPRALIPLGICALIALDKYIRKNVTALTPGAMRAKDWYSPEGVRARERAAGIPSFWERLTRHPFVRYSLAAVCFWMAYEWIQNPKDGKDGWIPALMFIVAGMWLSKEVSKWLLGAIALIIAAVLLFKGIAALPVSIAVIIGAIIIAGALRR